MKPLQQHANLFANGEFEAKADFSNDGISKDFWVQGVYTIKSSDLHNRVKLGVSWVRTGYCTLIARPIESMTDEECNHILKMMYGEQKGEDINMNDVMGFGTSITEGTLYLLSIGVYPFDQSHFDDGTVIKASEVAV